MNKNFLKLLSFVMIISAIIIYLITCFIMWSFDISTIEPALRFFIVLLWIGITIALMTILYNE